MFIGVKELEQHKLTVREIFPPGTIDFRTREFRQVAPLRVELTAELDGREIHLAGRFATRLGLTCARCLESLEREVSSTLDLLYRPVNSVDVNEGDEIELPPEDIDIGFYTGRGLFLADALAEQIHLALPMKMVCREECRGLCSGCGANLNREQCRCGPRPVDPRLAPLAAWAERKKQPSKT
jgi:uncharacterized protein